MPLTNTSSVVAFDADAVCEAVIETVTGTPRSIVEYDRQAFNPLYVDDVTLAFYDDEAGMEAHFERIHSYVHVDFTEMGLFTEELVPIADSVRFIATGLSVFTLLRVYVGDEGLFLALDPDEPIEPVVRTIETTLATAA